MTNFKLSENQRVVIVANGSPSNPELIRKIVQPDDLIIAADGGARLCRQLGIQPHIMIGDFDSLEPAELAAFTHEGVESIRYAVQKDYTDLELALLHAQSLGARDVLVLAALGARWDQTLANLLLPAATHLKDLRIRLLDGLQEISLMRSGNVLTVTGQPGDTVSLIPLLGDVHGVQTTGLQYPLHHETLVFGATRGLSNVLQEPTASIKLEQGLLMCVTIHQDLR